RDQHSAGRDADPRNDAHVHPQDDRRRVDLVGHASVDDAPLARLHDDAVHELGVVPMNALFDTGRILLFVLLLARASGFIAAGPFWGDAVVPAKVKALFALALTVCLFG